LRIRPHNDEFAQRAPLSGYVAGDWVTLAGSTAETGEPNHQGIPPVASAWWTWTAPGSGPVAWQNSLGAAVAVYTGNSLSGLTPVAGRTNYYPGFLGFDATAGVTYQIALNSSDAATWWYASLYWEQTTIALALSNLTVFREGETVPLQITTTE